ncbi:alpha/beta hydrolase [Enterococcus saigonensis]|nr:alpha/beta hydrolase [Enterococcus saigonensis]
MVYKKEVIFDEEANSGITLYLNDLCAENELRKKPFILVIPGGGYSYCSDREAEPIALSYVVQGFHAGVLRYHVGKYRDFEKSLQDGKKALDVIEQIDEKFNVSHDKIAIIGFSAGGHLAAAMCTLLKKKPTLCILGYPAILSSFAEVMKISAPSLDQCVSKDTPPTFLFSTFEDNVVPIENSLYYLKALEENDIPFESHIYQKGLHGLSLANSLTGDNPKMIDSRFSHWLNLSCEWMNLNWSHKATTNSCKKSMIESCVQEIISDDRRRQKVLELFPKIQNKSYYKIVRKYTLQQLHHFAPEEFTNDKIKRLTALIQGKNEIG